MVDSIRQVFINYHMLYRSYLIGCRAEGRVLVFKYVRGSFSAEDDKRLTNGVKAIVAENIVCVFFACIMYKTVRITNTIFT